MDAPHDPNDIAQHNAEIQANLASWQRKPVLAQVYRGFHERIARERVRTDAGLTVGLGSGIGNIKDVIPHCVRTDLFPNPWIDRVENAYALSFAGGSVANLILFDVFHHLRYPGTALREFARVLAPGGRVILFEPCLSLLGRLVYGAMHPEPLGLGERIEWLAPRGWSPVQADYYAAQGNATRIFLREELGESPGGWRIARRQRLSAISYVASGGYSGPQLYPAAALPLMRGIDTLCDLLPAVFATRLLVVLEPPAA
jgi:SAM-dependent methyltransferase